MKCFFPNNPRNRFITKFPTDEKCCKRAKHNANHTIQQCLQGSEKRNAGKDLAVTEVSQLSYRTALLIGAFQCLALIPGTSRSGATILGGIFLGVSRAAAAEFSFFLAIPTMLGASALKLLKFLLEGHTATFTELAVLITGCVVSFLVSLLVIKGLMEYVRRHSFKVFGVYRIVLGAVVIGYFLLTAL